MKATSRKIVNKYGVYPPGLRRENSVLNKKIRRRMRNNFWYVCPGAKVRHKSVRFFKRAFVREMDKIMQEEIITIKTYKK